MSSRMQAKLPGSLVTTGGCLNFTLRSLWERLRCFERPNLGSFWAWIAPFMQDSSKNDFALVVNRTQDCRKMAVRLPIASSQSEVQTSRQGIVCAPDWCRKMPTGLDLYKPGHRLHLDSIQLHWSPCAGDLQRGDYFPSFWILKNYFMNYNTKSL